MVRHPPTMSGLGSVVLPSPVPKCEGPGTLIVFEKSHRDRGHPPGIDPTASRGRTLNSIVSCTPIIS
jgi:hypothetical protein